MRIFFISFWCIFFSTIAQVHASDNPPLTNWGGVFKVPVDKIDAVDQAVKNWGNWIKKPIRWAQMMKTTLPVFRLPEAFPSQAMFIT